MTKPMKKPTARQIKHITTPKVAYKKPSTPKKAKIEHITKKPVKVIGTAKALLENPITGEKEAIDLQYMQIEQRDFNFNKIWIAHIIEALGMLGGAKIKAALWLLDHRDENNYVFVTAEKLAKECKISYVSAQLTLKALKNADFIKQPKGCRGGVYQISPNIIFKGSHKKRMSVLLDYCDNSEPSLPGLEN